MQADRKKILILGGTVLQIPFIEKVKSMGHYVITCDNKPDNPGHKIADEYYNVSITDKEAVFYLAKKLNADAVVNYSLEAGVQAAAYAQEKLGKPTSPYESVKILSNKKLFREFLKKHGFRTPGFITCHNKAEACTKISALHFPVVVKPTDLWGSRGVTMVNTKNELDNALEYAFANSRGADIIIEEFVEADGAPIEGNGFAVDGKLTTHAWADVYSDLKADNPITPVCFCYPSDKPQSQLKKLDETLQRLLTLLDMKTNAYNIEARIDKQGNIYLMEVAPRNGGNTSHDILSFLTGKDIQKAILLAALGEDCSFMDDTTCTKYWMGYVVHSNVEGIYKNLWIEAEFKKNNLQRYIPLIEEGSKVETYSGTNCTIGALLASFNTREEMMTVVQDTSRKFRPSVWLRSCSHGCE